MLEDIRRELAGLEDKGRLRTLRTISERRGPFVEIEGRRLLNLASNDYLGLSVGLEPDKILEILREFGTGAGASRLLSGNHLYYEILEETLRSLYGRPALVFASGYLANLGVLSGLLGRRDVVFADKLIHASLIDGLRLSGATFYRYPHLNLELLEDLLKEHRSRFRRAVILTESVFSMDGDFPDLRTLVALKKRYEAFLMVDEAHAVGVFGKRGLGLSEEEGLLEEIDVLIGTFGKALGSYGAFVVTHEEIRRLLISRARSFIFTTALPPVVVAASLSGLRRAVDMERERRKLRELSRKLRRELRLSRGGLQDEVPIVPVIIGEDRKALEVSKRLFEAGFFAPAIRPPTVPEGTARLRLSLSASMDWSHLEPLIGTLRSLACA
ncbi:aminotransferase class I/II-fold pyridoxal phosphate-dependent enzyme [Thermosulfurimonas dismutans]|uniref:8-amino-7-oxononanoate synthase n=1 Tax=Thermosulfurimonas dismutans TaxID=999894 RepID=A0A179D4X4_9BACT|nr:8-amino-7-oxononanoate synthase [Thermosulfurimonas dismutans]OAQ21107.1 8-amino-7-oxononanoate synthase [Thermosulfurimonas dismutans]